MNIIHLCQYYSEKVGYQEPNLVKSQNNNNHRVLVVTSDRFFPFPDYENSYQKLLGNRIIGPSSNNNIIRLKPLFERESNCTLLLPPPFSFFDNFHPDILISHGLLNPNTLWSCIYKIFHPRVKLIFDSHMAEYNTQFNTFLKRTYLLLWRIFIRPLVIKSADKIIATGENEKHFTQKYLLGYSIPILISPLGADNEIFYPLSSAKKIEIRRKYGYTPDDIILINAGKINSTKKNLELVKVFCRLQINNPKLKLILVGGGDIDYLNQINKYIETNFLKNKIKITDFVENSKLGLILSMSDIGVWPGSKSNVFVEAIACGLPLIIEDKAYAHDYTKNNNGFNINSENELLLALLKLIQSPKLMKTMGKNSRQLYINNFSWDKISLQYLN